MYNFVLAMGGGFSSGVAQRGYNQWIQRLYTRVDARDAALREAEPELNGWYADRAALPHDCYGRHDRLWSADAYTDDVIIVVGGAPQRPVMIAEEFHDLLGPEGLQITFAKHAKWLISCWSQWIGASSAAMLGLMWLSPAKVLRCDAQLARLEQQGVTMDEFRRLLGFLNHVAEIIFAAPGTSTTASTPRASARPTPSPSTTSSLSSSAAGGGRL